MRLKIMDIFRCGIRRILWTLQYDGVSHKLFTESIYKDEDNERKAVERLLLPGQTFLDIGAHHGFYTLLASRIVGATGMVLSFEPSPNSFAVLEYHVQINKQDTGIENVCLWQAAAAAAEGSAAFYVVEEGDTGRNSLRPVADCACVEITVPTVYIPNLLRDISAGKVDFVKLDAEGAELIILEALRDTLIADTPIVLVELRQFCTQCWGYNALEIYDYLVDLGYEFFTADRDGLLIPFPRQTITQHNLFAVHTSSHPIKMQTIVPAELFCSADLARTEDRYWETDLYPVLRDIVARIRPRTILEIGTRYGYSLAVMLDAAPTVQRAYSLDMMEGVLVYGGEPGAYTQAQENLLALRASRWPRTVISFHDGNTQDLDAIDFIDEQIDLAYIDGDHSPNGLIHDIWLVYPLLSPCGVIIVDDMDHHPEMREPTEMAARVLMMDAEYYPDQSRRGRMVLTKRGAGMDVSAGRVG
jgi:FkbM family methyltransferase